MQNPDSVLLPEQELHIRKMLAGMSPIDLLFLAAKANPKSRFNMHHNAPNAGMGKHIVARKLRAYHRRRKAAR